MLKKVTCAALIVVLLLGLVPGCSSGWNEPIDELSEQFELRAAVLYSGGESWKDTLYYLKQSPMLGLSVQAKQVSGHEDFSPYDILYLDESLLNDAPAGFTESVYVFTEAGGAVFLPNSFCEFFTKDYLASLG